MFLKTTNLKNGRSYLSIVEGYRLDGKVKQRTIKKIGFLDELLKDYDDPISHFKALADQMTSDAKDDTQLLLPINTYAPIGIADSSKNVGYIALKRIYDAIDFASFFKPIQIKKSCDYSLNKIFQLLVFSRILFPASKKETFDSKDVFFQPFQHFSLKDLYRSLDDFSVMKSQMEQWIWLHTKEAYQRDASHTYYDCTNYYFEIAYNDDDLIDEYGTILEKGYRKRGPEKNKRPDPIISMGLLMDANGIPLSYELFPGNESEKTTVRPIIKRTKADFGINKTIVVADRGLNTSDNMYFLAGKNDDAHRNHDGYVYGQSVRGGDKEFKSWVLAHEGYQAELIKDGENEVAFIHKSRVYGKSVKIKRDGKRNVNVIIYQKQLAYYSSTYARKQKKEREQMIAKAKELIKKPGNYTKATSYGAANYVNNLVFDKEAGEIKTDTILTLDKEKISEEEKYDGFYSIVTSEKELSDKEIRDIYRGLIKIEDTFKVSKTNLKSRPVYVWTKEHIEAHFLTCFVSLVLTRLLEKRLENNYSVNQITESLKKYNCINIDKNLYQFIYRDEVIEAIEKAFEIDLNKKYRKKEEIRKLLRY